MNETIKQTLNQIAQGFTVQNEYDILPVYYGTELVNRAAYGAYRFKRFAQAFGHLTTEAASRTAVVTAAAIGHVAHYGGTGSFGEA